MPNNPKSVTEVLNNAHLAYNTTLGSPKETSISGSPLTPSINFSTAYAFKDIGDLGEYHENKFDSVRYTRDSSELVKQIEYYFELMYQDSKVLLFNSGMAAISAVINAHIKKSTTIVCFGNFYRKTLSIFEVFAENFGVKILNFNNFSEYKEAHITGEDVLVYLESPSNPFLRLMDIEEIKKINPKATVVLDITFQGLLNTKNIFDSVDIIISSCTKYIGGHNDVLGGFVVTKKYSTYTKIWDERSMRGGIIDNFSTYFLLRSMRTYDIRMEKTLSNTSKVLSFLKNDENVQNIYYPGQFSNVDQKTIFDKYHTHGGGVVTFKISDDNDVSDNLTKLCSTKMAPSFGSVDTLIEIPMFMSHWGKTNDDLKELGLDKNTVRLSVGNEPIEYIIDDLKRLL